MSRKEYSYEIVEAINNFLNEDDWHFSFDEERGLFRFNLSLKGKIQKVNYVIDVKDDSFIVYAISPLGANHDDPENLTAMAEFVCRANYGLRNGNFELDMRDGEVRYKCFVDCDGIIPDSAVIRNSIYMPAAMFDRYGEGIVSVIFGMATAEDAVRKCEEV